MYSVQGLLILVFTVLATISGSGAVADVGTAAYYSSPYTPTECYGDDPSQLPPGNLFAAVGGDLWDNGAACGRVYEVRCISGLPSVPSNCASDLPRSSTTPSRDSSAAAYKQSVTGTTLVVSEDAFNAIAKPFADSVDIEFQGLHVIASNPLPTSSAAMICLSSDAMILLAAATLLVLLYVTTGRNVAGDVIGPPSDPSRLFRSGDDDSVGTRWAVLTAGSKGYRNYRHQVKKRTANDNTAYGSHVMQSGDIGSSKENLFLYMGTNPANDNSPFVDDNSLRPPQKGVDQRDADLLYFWHEFLEAPEGSSRKLEAQKQFFEAMSHRMHIDESVKLIGKLLFGIKKSPEVLNAVRPVGQPLVDDWACLRSLVRTFETHCGSLSEYGLKHMRSFANMCNAGIQTEQMTEASGEACARIPPGRWSSLSRGFSA